MADGLSLRDLVVRYGDRTVVDGVTLDLRPGRLVALVGGSGSGKTTVLRALLGLVDAAPGVVAGTLTVTVGGRSAEPYARARAPWWRRGARLERLRRDRAFAAVRGRMVGLLPQDGGASLVPWVTVGTAIAASAALPLADGPTRRHDPRPWLVEAGFEEVVVDRVAAALPHQLSGGMAERAALAVALARGSRFLLADEPTTGLDTTSRARVWTSLRQRADQGHGVLVVTHDGDGVRERADEVLTLAEGRVVGGVR